MSISTPQSLSDEQDGIGTSQASPPLLATNYSIAKDRARRRVVPLKKYIEVDLVAYSLNVAEGIDCCEEPSTYDEVMSFDDSNR